MQRIDRARQVALDELALERERGGGDHDSLAVCQRGDQISQRLAGTGARLYEEVASVIDGLGDGFGHSGLTWAFGTPDGGDGGLEEFGEGGLAHRPDTLRGGTDTPPHDDRLCTPRATGSFRLLPITSGPFRRL
ncbi:hypothetical protein GCM10009863_45220 [Streptomyces axinellae]|uniref:Uncharacterized protein n=1 Tax=Streptomyces axinellae TaxID=552788 RepID=A0ABN3QG18_9ACTN